MRGAVVPAKKITKDLERGREREKEREGEKRSKGTAKKGRRSGGNPACSSELVKDAAKTIQLCVVDLDAVGRSVGRRFNPFLDLPISLQRSAPPESGRAATAATLALPHSQTATIGFGGSLHGQTCPIHDMN